MNKNLKKMLKKFGLTENDWKLMRFMEYPTIDGAVIFKCWECRGYPKDFSDASRCTQDECPLWPFRCAGDKSDR